MSKRLYESSLRLLTAAMLACTMAGCHKPTAPIPTEKPTPTPVVRYTPTPIAQQTPMPSLEELYTPTQELMTSTPTKTPMSTPTPTSTLTPTATPVPRVEIIGLSWQPVRVVNDKVYDGKVVFEAEGDKVLGYAELKFIPKEYPHLSKEAFPKEDPRRFVLEPLDGAFDELKEEFAVVVKNIIGGREYVVEAVVKDEDGNVSVERIKTPYIREFENLGNLLFEKGVIVSVSYYLWYDSWPWPTRTIPLLGKYTSSDQIVIQRHIDWITGSGCSLIFLSYSEPLRQNVEIFLSSPLIEDVKIAILYESLAQLYKKNGTWPVTFEGEFYAKNLEILKEDFEYFHEKIFLHESYWTINGMPVVYLFDSSAFLGNVEKALEELRNYLQTKYGFNPYLISDHINPGFPGGVAPTDPEWTAKANLYDGITAWGGGFYGRKIYLGDSYEEQLELLYRAWLPWALENNKGFFPSFKPGEDSRLVPWGGEMVLPRSPELFEERVKIMVKVLNVLSGTTRYFRIDTWNDSFEATEIEPSVRDGYTYMMLLGKLLRDYGLSR